MKEKKSKEQRKAEREERVAARHQRAIERHTVVCPHCGKDVLDHMTECPFCKGELTPTGYRAPDPKKKKTWKIIGYTFFITVAVAVVLFLIISRSVK